MLGVLFDPAWSQMLPSFLRLIRPHSFTFSSSSYIIGASGRLTCVVCASFRRQLARCCAWLVPSLQVDDSDGTFTDHENATSSSMHGSVAAAGDEVEDIDWNSSNRRGSTNHAREGAEEGNRPRTSSYGGGGNGFSSSGRCLRWLRGKGCGSGGTQPLRQKVRWARKRER